VSSSNSEASHVKVALAFSEEESLSQSAYAAGAA